MTVSVNKVVVATAEILADERWQAIQDNDPQYEDAFVFGVRTTGVYCRSTCRGAAVLRKNIEFFEEIKQARAAGYRACKRCRPDEGGPYSRAVDIVTRACALIDDNAEFHLAVSSIAGAVGVTEHALRRAFEMVLGITPRQYADARRLERLKAGLRNGDEVTTALYDSGYGSPSRLYESSDQRLGMTPGQYRRGGAGAAITYTIVDTDLGRLLVAATGKGVCRISLAGDDESLEAALGREFPQAERKEDSGVLEEWASIVAGLVSGATPRPSAQLPLDVQGTAFQRRVWEALRDIPLGQTRSYSEVAVAIGEPKAARAVANACGKNPTPVVVPCHRVVRLDGSLGGYALGAERKEALLKREGAI